MPTLDLYQLYTRRDVHDIFSPQTKFTPQAGTWGLQGIVKVPNTDDFVFFVTLGSEQGEHVFRESISNVGFLFWESQPKMNLSNPIIQKLIHHDTNINCIYFFYRNNKECSKYIYMGTLAYLGHDLTRECPVHFAWRLNNWPIPEKIVNGYELQFSIYSGPTDNLEQKTYDGYFHSFFNKYTEEELATVPTLDSKVFLLSLAQQIHEADGFHQTENTIDLSDKKMSANKSYPNMDFKKMFEENDGTGVMGEKIALELEKRRLQEAGRPDLAAKIYLTRDKQGNTAPFDILSYDIDGSEKYIEVKSTTTRDCYRFYISQREINFCKQNVDHYLIYRIFALNKETNEYKYFTITNPLDYCSLKPITYELTLNPQTNK